MCVPKTALQDHSEPHRGEFGEWRDASTPAARREVGTGRTWRSPCDLPLPEALTQAGETTMSTYSLRTPHVENHCFPQPRQPAPVLSARKPLEMSSTGKAQGFRTLHGHFEQVLLATSAIPLLGGVPPRGL